MARRRRKGNFKNARIRLTRTNAWEGNLCSPDNGCPDVAAWCALFFLPPFIASNICFSSSFLTTSFILTAPSSLTCDTETSRPPALALVIASTTLVLLRIDAPFGPRHFECRASLFPSANDFNSMVLLSFALSPLSLITLVFSLLDLKISSVFETLYTNWAPNGDGKYK
ncbi:hypothetical protein EUGRSUZ_I01457 [Eucalyptus grandis]|uniref:Uncharacterized protein n=2 Tax=Eucalyptus grandis TaxID=71139 RepID=A0ACC3JF96_EUCGR|nr:hypothetical protein EUGRSUZ_I01457 [Eucalyptus grandis]